MKARCRPGCRFACAVLAFACSSGLLAADEISPYTEEAVERGLIYEIQVYATGPSLGFGIAIVDLNNNGLNDVVLLGHPSGRVGFFENNPKNLGYFIDRSYTSDDQGNPVPKWSLPRPSGIAVADYNGNGMLDLYITQSMNQTNGALFPNVLLRNEGDFNFTEVTQEKGVGSTGHSHGAAWGDFDHDGWLDLYVANYTFNPPDPTHWSRLYRNPGPQGGAFEDVTLQHGVENKGQGFTPVFTDVNRNGWLDLYLANDRGHVGPTLPPNQLWMNEQGQLSNICPAGTHWPVCEDCSPACIGLWSMCVAAGDFTGNGYVDFYITNIAHPAGYNGWNPLIVNHGETVFTEGCVEAGVCSVATSWCGIFYDYDNNGWLDLYVCNQNIGNRLFANTGVFPTTEIGQNVNVAGNSGVSYSAAVGDATGNGALDLILNNYGQTAPVNIELFINHEGTKRNWIRFNVVGHDGNVHAIGANIELTSDGHTQWREIYAGGNNYKAQNELVFHFGLDQATVAEQIIVNWPAFRGSRTLTNYPANHHWTIYPEQMLGDSNGDGIINVFDLLAMLSAWGSLQPGSEIMDLNGDGVINVFDLLALLSKWGPIQ